MPWPPCTQADVVLFTEGRIVACPLGSCAPQHWGGGSNPMADCGQRRYLGCRYLLSVCPLWPQLGHCPMSYNFSLFFSLWQQLEERKGVLLSWESEEHHLEERQREAASLTALSLWGRETMQVVPGGGLAEEHSPWASSSPRQLPPLPCLHPDPALYPCFLRNNYPKTELKSISWSREWPVWKFSDVSELRLCQ